MTLRLRRGTDAERQTIIFAEGELVYVIDTKKVYAGDGTTPGGLLLNQDFEDLTNVNNGTIAGQTLLWNGSEWDPTNDITVLTDSVRIRKRASIEDSLLLGTTATNNDNFIPLMVTTPFSGGFGTNSTIVGENYSGIVLSVRLDRYTVGGELFFSITRIGGSASAYLTKKFLFNKVNDTDYTLVELGSSGTTELFAQANINTVILNSNLFLQVTVEVPTTALSGGTLQIIGQVTYTSHPFTVTVSGFNE